MESVTAPVNPPEGVTVIVLLPFEPCATDRLPGEAVTVKSGIAALIVKLMMVVWVSVPEVPVIVIVLVPVAAVLLAVKVTELVDVAGLVL